MTDANLSRSIRAIGLYQYVMGTLLLLAGIFGVVSPFMVPEARDDTAMLLGMAVFWLAMSLLFYLLGWNLRRFKPAGRTGTIILSCFGLLFFPLGTILNGVFLYVLISGGHLFNRLPPVMGESPKIVTGNS